jgi:hypothetical protein
MLEQAQLVREKREAHEWAASLCFPPFPLADITFFVFPSAVATLHSFCEIQA